MNIAQATNIFIPGVLSAANVGAGQGVFKQLTAGQQAEFYSLAAGLGIDISLVADAIVLEVDETDLNIPTVLSDLTDVDTAGVVGEDMLRYNSGDSTWKPASRSAYQRLNNVSGALNNNSSNVTVKTYNKANTYGDVLHYHLYRKDDTLGEKIRSGLLVVHYRVDSDDFLVEDMDFFNPLNDMGVTWSINSAGQLQYTTTNFSGSNYVSSYRLISLGECSA